MTSGEGLLTSFTTAQRRAMLVFILTLALAGSRFVTESWAAGAFAIGKCGAYGQAFDYAGEADARIAARKQCKGECTTVTIKPRISTSLNEATRKCYEFGGKECVIRAWACDAKG
jgi:hypothetical protein